MKHADVSKAFKEWAVPALLKKLEDTAKMVVERDAKIAEMEKAADKLLAENILLRGRNTIKKPTPIEHEWTLLTDLNHDESSTRIIRMMNASGHSIAAFSQTEVMRASRQKFRDVWTVDDSGNKFAVHTDVLNSMRAYYGLTNNKWDRPAVNPEYEAIPADIMPNLNEHAKCTDMAIFVFPRPDGHGGTYEKLAQFDQREVEEARKEQGGHWTLRDNSRAYSLTRAQYVAACARFEITPKEE